METIFRINNFDSLDREAQEEIQDFVTGITQNWEIEIFNHCDVCGKCAELIRKETEGGIIRICKNCNLKND